MKNTKLILGIIVLIALVIVGAYFKNGQSKSQDTPSPSPTNIQAQDKSPRIVSTNPDPLENAIVPAAGTIELIFNQPIQNIGEFKVRIEPKVDFKRELSSDRKTAKIIPNKPMELGVTYTLFIGPETKFDGTGNWGQEKIYHFQTIKYTGV